MCFFHNVQFLLVVLDDYCKIWSTALAVFARLLHPSAPLCRHSPSHTPPSTARARGSGARNCHLLLSRQFKRAASPLCHASSPFCWWRSDRCCSRSAPQPRLLQPDRYHPQVPHLHVPPVLPSTRRGDRFPKGVSRSPAPPARQQPASQPASCCRCLVTCSSGGWYRAGATTTSVACVVALAFSGLVMTRVFVRARSTGKYRQGCDAAAGGTLDGHGARWNG
jgi:hypothetical protein